MMDARFFSPMKNGCSTDVRCACVGLFYFCVMEKGGGRARQAHSLVPASNFSLTCKSFDRAEGLTSSLWVYYSFCVCVCLCVSGPASGCCQLIPPMMNITFSFGRDIKDDTITGEWTRM